MVEARRSRNWRQPWRAIGKSDAGCAESGIWSVTLRDVRKAFDHVFHNAPSRAMEGMGVGAHSRALMAKAWSLSKIRARLANKTSEQVNLERGLPQGAAESPIIFANGPRTRGHTMRRAMGKERLGLLGRLEEMGERELCGRHLSHQRNKARLGGHDQRHHKRTEGCGLVSAQTRHTVHHTLRNLTQWEQVLVFVGMALDLSGSSWASIRHRLSPGTASLRKWAPIFKSK